MRLVSALVYLGSTKSAQLRCPPPPPPRPAAPMPLPCSLRLLETCPYAPSSLTSLAGETCPCAWVNNIGGLFLSLRVDNILAVSIITINYLGQTVSKDTRSPCLCTQVNNVRGPFWGKRAKKCDFAIGVYNYNYLAHTVCTEYRPPCLCA